MVTETPTAETAPQLAVDGSIAWWNHAVKETDPCCTEVLGTDGVVTALPGVGIPSFSPDGQYVLTTPSDAEAAALGSELPDGETDVFYVVKRDGTITATIMDALAPSWQRLAP